MHRADSSFTNRVVFAGSSSGYFVALDANTGLTYWKFNSGNAVAGSPAIFNETLYWGTGYKSQRRCDHAVCVAR